MGNQAPHVLSRITPRPQTLASERGGVERTAYLPGPLLTAAVGGHRRRCPATEDPRRPVRAGADHHAGGTRAIRRLRAAAGEPSPREPIAAPAAAGQPSHSAHSALTGRRLPTEQLLTAFAAAYGAGEEDQRCLARATSSSSPFASA